eukprot:TRINITY_DN11230_c0_g1_i1.p1 TRINITY_DN11230_c0_g1~~TRINITY_DN11230_c0_g1_i1.p1  ORF type:complete len:299 (-),score=15.17 TRINITY_DN11230_c0_g1_i1:124-1020(-)
MEVIAGGLSAAGACFFTNPMEVVKNRLQLQGELKAKGHFTKHYRGPLHGLFIMARTDGFVALQSGLAPAICYQLVMNGLRLGSYAEMERRGLLKTKKGETSFSRVLVGSSVSGLLGGLVGSPIYLVKTQMQTSSSAAISVGYQHKHTGMITAFSNIYSAAGLRGLWQGATASVPRISIGSAAQLLSYRFTMDKLNEFGWFGSDDTSWKNNIAGATLSGFVVAVVINPFDVLSTRLYNQPRDQRMYSGYLDCVRQILRTEGPLAFYKGLVAQYMRIGPHSFLSLVFWHHTRTAMGLKHS